MKSNEALNRNINERLYIAHHIWQRSTVGISWKEKIMNKDLKVRTEQQRVDNVQIEG